MLVIKRRRPPRVCVEKLPQRGRAPADYDLVRRPALLDVGKHLALEDHAGVDFFLSAHVARSIRAALVMSTSSLLM